LLCWQFAAAILGAVSACILGNGNLVSKIYFPRILLPAGTTLSTLVDLAISLGIMLVLMLAFGVWPTWRILTLPLFIVLTLALAGGVGLWLAVFAVRYRDVLHIVPVAVQLSMYLSPVGYLTSNVPEKYQVYYALNPLVGVIGGFRWALLGESFPIDWFAMSVSCAAAAVFMTVGLLTFVRGEHRFADEL
jgi:lipopolysaccharide transport system permease protein